MQDSVRIAELHLSHDPALGGRVQYRASSLEELVEEEEEKEGFHAVLASEVLEHLADLDTFIDCCHHLLKVTLFRCVRISAGAISLEMFCGHSK